MRPRDLQGFGPVGKNGMSAPVDVLAVLGHHAAGLRNTAECKGKLSPKALANLADELARVESAVAELIEASTPDLWSPDKGTRIAARRRWDAALARCGGQS